MARKFLQAPSFTVAIDTQKQQQQAGWTGNGRLHGTATIGVSFFSTFPPFTSFPAKLFAFLYSWQFSFCSPNQAEIHMCAYLIDFHHSIHYFFSPHFRCFSAAPSNNSSNSLHFHHSLRRSFFTFFLELSIPKIAHLNSASCKFIFFFWKIPF